MKQKTYLNFAGLSYFLFFGAGAFVPLLAEYLKNIGFSGVQMGTVFSFGTLISILFQPFWGFLNDKTQRTREILGYMLITVCILLAFFLRIRNFYIFVAVFGLYQFFWCGVFPINDSIVLKSDFEYGPIRQWGSIGFAMAVFVSGVLVDNTGIYIIFIVSIAAYLISMIFLRGIPVEKSSVAKISVSDIKELLKNKNYTFFLLAAFFIGGTMNANNTYFAILYRSLGGTMTGVGLAFLLFASSEAPFMKYSPKIIEKVGIEKMLGFSAVVFCARWFWYGTAPDPKLMTVLFFLQGMSIGIFIAGSAHYIKQNTSLAQRTTALTFYGSFSMGIGTMFCVFISGIIMDFSGIEKVYIFYFLWSILGFVILIYTFNLSNKLKKLVVQKRC